MDAGRALSRARRLAGLSQRELADRAGVTQSTIARVESGSMGIRVSTFDKLLGECGFALEVERRLGVGVDRTLFSFAEPPQRRIELMARASVNVSELFGSARKEESPGPFDPSRMLAELVHGNVDFILIGGMADAAHGGASITNDLDICYSGQGANVERLADVLRLHEAVPRDGASLDPRELRVREISTFATSLGNFDCVRMPRGTFGYDDLARDSFSIDIRGNHVLLASLDDLVRMKRASGRLPDLGELEVLGALREEAERAEIDNYASMSARTRSAQKFAAPMRS